MERAGRGGEGRYRRGFYARLYWALAKLRDGLLSTPTLASRFGVSQRTAYRDLDFLRDSWNVEMEYDPTRRGFVLKGEVPRLPPARLSHGEMVALLFAERLARQYRGTPFEAQVREAFLKLEALLPVEVEVESDQLDALVSVDLGPVYVADPATFSTVLKAAMERRVLRARYTSLSSNGTRVRQIHPYRVFNLRGDWYVAAYDPGHREVRDFAMHRFREATALQKRFNRDPSFDFDEYKAKSFGIEKSQDAAVPVRLQFAPRQARWIRERQWHQTARLHEAKDGGVTLELHVAPSSELVRWILQFGAEVEVDAPTSLRTQVAAHLRKATGLYDAEEGLPAHRRDRAKMKGPRPTLPRSTLHPKGDVS